MQPPHTPRQLDERVRRVARDVALVRDDGDLLVEGGEVEVERHEALACARLQLLEDVLVAGVVGHDELKALGRLDELARLVDRQHAPIVGQRVDDDDGVLPRLDDLVEVADRAVTGGEGQRAVLPHGLAAADEVAAEQIVRRQVVVAGDRHERAPEPPRHVLDEARLAAAGRALEHHGEVALVAAREDGHLVVRGDVVRLGLEAPERPFLTWWRRRRPHLGEHLAPTLRAPARQTAPRPAPRPAHAARASRAARAGTG